MHTASAAAQGAARPDHGVRSPSGDRGGSGSRRRARALVFALITVAVIVATLDYEQISTAFAHEEACDAAQQYAARLVQQLFLEESNLRAFTSTRDEHYLGSLGFANAGFYGDVGALENYLADARLPYVTAYVDDIERVHAQWHEAVATPLIADPSGDLSRSRQRTGELLMSTAADDATFLEDLLEGESERSQRAEGLDVKFAVAEIALLSVIFGFAVIGMQRAGREAERRHFEAIAEANIDLNKAQQLAGVGTWAKDLRSGKMTWSDELCRMLGADRAEMTEAFLRGFDHPDDAALVRYSIAAAHEADRTYSFEHRIVPRSGGVRFVQEQGEIVRDAAGKPLKEVGTIIDVTERKQTEEILAHLAQHDSLTGLPNRALLYDRMAQAVEFAKRQNRSVAIMYLDVDRFKIVNDSLGHSAGDALIVAVAERLRRYVRGCDTVSRMGGDEFVVLLADLQDRVDVRAVAEKLLSRFAEPFSVEGREIFLSASAGVSTYPADGDVVNELLEHADAAMYLAKERGRNNVQFYTADLHTFNTRKLSLEQDLRKGLERGEFVLHYQPIVAVPNGAVVGLEALVRWQHPASGLVMPGEFIPAAEESGLIVPLGEWVLATAIRQQRDFQHAGLACGRITVNISARQFQQRDFRHTIAALMREHGVQPGDLELELTESLVMRDVDASLRALHELSAMGVALSLDDFGTGYSSLNYLKRFPIDTIKIDRCFVSGVNGDAFDEAICQAIVTLSRSLHVRVVAEGVESQPQLAKLQRLGCDEAQGCLFSAAVPAAAAARLLSARTNRYA